MNYNKVHKNLKNWETANSGRENAKQTDGHLSISLRRVFDHLLTRLCVETRLYYGPRLTTLAIFGSVGRRTPVPDSDIDILVIANDLPHGRIARVREFDAIEVELENDLAEAAVHGVNTRLSPIFRTEDEMNVGGLIFLDMIDDARILFDKDSFFQRYLDRLRNTLSKNKAVRVRTGSTWHWVLKPDLKPGEEFEL